MLKPRSQGFKVKVLLSKLQAVSNKVISRCHATFKIDGEEMAFKVVPQLKKNVALFNSEVQFQSFSIYFDEITGLYENKQGVLVVQIETQGTKMKMGEVAVNLGGILNEKKYRIVNTFPLAKCFDKTAKAKLSMDFVPLGGPESFTSQKKQRRQTKEIIIRQNISNSASDKLNLGSPTSNPGGWKAPNYKSRLAEESNYILQEKIYDYEQKMDNYRLSQTQLQEKLHEQISNKDEHINEMTVEINRRGQQLAAANLENEQLRFRVKEQNDEIVGLKDQVRGLLGMIEGLNRAEETLKKEIQSVRASLDNQGRTRDNKEKYYSQQLSKYTARYLESEQERNKIIFELETKFKEEMDKKETGYRSIIAANDKKQAEIVQHLRDKIKKLENEMLNRDELLQKYAVQAKRYEQTIFLRCKQLAELTKKHEELIVQEQATKKKYIDTSSELETVNFSYNQLEREAERYKEEVRNARQNIEQLKMEIQMANQTIEEQRRNITKYTKELQVHRERSYFLTEKYNEELEIRSVNEDNIRGESLYYRDEINKLRGQLRIAEERADQESRRAGEVNDSLQRVEIELTNRSQLLVRMGEEKIALESEQKALRAELADMEEAVLVLREQNMALNDNLRDQRAAMENDKSLEWSYKIQELQNDISEMVEKFKVEKDAMRENFKREDAKKKEEINQLALLLRKAKEQNEELRRGALKRENSLKDIERAVEELRGQLKQKGDDCDDLRDKWRTGVYQYEQMEKRLKASEENAESRLREAESRGQRQSAIAKKLEQYKNGYQKAIQQVLDYLTKPFQSFLAFQQISSAQVEGQFLNLINLSLKKHCEQRTKMREQIKKYQSSSNIQSVEFKKIQIQAYRSKEKRTIITENHQMISSKLYPSIDYDTPWKYGQRSNDLESDDLRHENSRLKREISELKVKMRSVQEEVGKAQRNADTERQSRNQAKRQLQEAQDELDKLNFQLKRKDKVIAQFQGELKDLQGEVIALRNSQAMSSSKPQQFSRSEVRMREKEQALSNNRKDIVIRDLQLRVDNKSKEMEDALSELSKLRSQNNILKESVSNLTNESKLLQNKYKDRVAKFNTQECQYQQSKDRLQKQLNCHILKHKQQIQALADQLLKIQEQSVFHQRTNQMLRKQIQQLQRRAKAGRQQVRSADQKTKRQHELALNRLKENISELQTTILTLRSELQHLQLRQQQSTVKNASLSALLTKKNAEIQSLSQSTKIKEQRVYELEEELSTLRMQSDSKINELRQLIQELEEERLKKEYEIEEYRFTSEGRLLDLEKRLEDANAANKRT